MNRKNESGITLVALIVAVIVMLILASVTLNTTFTAYETTRAEKFKAQMKVLQESATSLNAEYLNWQKEKEEECREEFRNNTLEIKNCVGILQKAGIHKEKIDYKTYNYMNDSNLSDSQKSQYAKTFKKLKELLQDARLEVEYYKVILESQGIYKTNVDYETYDYKSDSTIDEVMKERMGWIFDKIKNIFTSNKEMLLDSKENLTEYYYSIYNMDSFLKEKKKNLEEVDEIRASDLEKIDLDDIDVNVRNSITADFYNIPHSKKNLELIATGNLITDDPMPEEEDAIESGELVEANANIGISIGSCEFYKFSKSNKDLEYYLGAKNIDFDTIYIDFEHLFIFTTEPVKIDGEKLYTQYAFSDSNTIFKNDTQSTISNASILVDVVANYGTSQKISLTLDSNGVKNNNNVDYRIRKAYYKNNYTLNGSNDKGVWYEVDDLKECEYSEDGKSVTFIVYESGDYNFSIEDVSGEYTDKMKQNVSLNIKNEKPKYNDVEEYNITLCNAPVLNPDMIPVKWIYSDKKKIEGKWVVCTTIDPEWYNYSKDYKMWANIMFNHDKNTIKDLKPGVELSEAEMGSMFVWIPRFSMSASENNVNFLRGTSRTPTTGYKGYANDVWGENAFRNVDYSFGGWDSELKGLWFSKYDIGLEDVDKTTNPKPNITKVNTSIESVASNYNKLYSVSQNSDNRIVRPVSKPYYITWRNISYTNAFSQALMYYNNFNHASKEKDLNTHLMKGSELNVLYEITESKYYGNKNISSNSSNKLSAGSDGVNGYSFQKEYINQSSTGNITGIFDVIGTTDVMISDIGVVLNKSEYEKEYLYNNLMQKINVIDNVEEYSNITNSDIQNIQKNSSKYYTVASSDLGIGNIREGKYFIKIGEKTTQHGRLSYEWTKLSQTVSPNYGFRIVISNSPSGDTSNYIYDSTNISEIARDDLPGFYVTDENGNYIKNADGKFLDSEGNKTFYPWNEMIDKGWIKVEDGVVNKGDNISELKQKTGILVISDSVDSLGYNVFEYWYKNDLSSNLKASLLKVIMPDTITQIKYRAFYSCKDLKDIKFSKNLKVIGDQAFEHCSSLVNYSLPESLEIIGIGAFENCSSLESITIPRNVKIIGHSAFRECSNVTNLDILSEVNGLVLDEWCFSKLRIQSLLIPKNVSIIGESAFRFNTELKNVKIEEGITEINAGAFCGCTNLTTINFPSTLTSLGNNKNWYLPHSNDYPGVFQYCSSLETIDLTATQINTLHFASFFGCSSLKEVNLPITGLKRIDDMCFMDCPELKYLKLPETIEKIDRSVFGYWALTTDEIPNINLGYMGNASQWDEIEKTNDSESVRWCRNINVIVETSDGEVIEYP